MSRTILAGVDGSANSLRALGMAIEIAGGVGAEVVAVHAVGLLSHLAPGAEPVISQQHRKELALAFAEQWCLPLALAGIPYRTLLVDGDPVRVILDQAEQDDAWIIVVGTRGHRLTDVVPLGSTSHQLLMASSRPVLVIPPSEPGTPAPPETT